MTNPASDGRPSSARARCVRRRRAKRVVVVGGGPAGLEAAWVAAARGHEVTLLERADALGGKIRLAETAPGSRELADFADWRIGECRRRGVDVRVGVDATADTVLALGPDAVVVATGARATIDGRVEVAPDAGCRERPAVRDRPRAARSPEATRSTAVS